MGKVIYLMMNENGGKNMKRRIMEKGELDARDVAEYFLTKEKMSNKKLQKLCYYAQAWHYAFYDKGLFYQDIEAWVHGPVVRDVYNKYRDYKWNDIPKPSANNFNFIDKEEEFLDDVYCKYGEFDGDELEILTHQELPWQEAREGLEEWEPSDVIIEPRTMSDYYWSKYDNNN